MGSVSFPRSGSSGEKGRKTGKTMDTRKEGRKEGPLMKIYGGKEKKELLRHPV